MKAWFKETDNDRLFVGKTATERQLPKFNGYDLSSTLAMPASGKAMPRRFTIQPAPKVTDADVWRVVKRDFPQRDFRKVLALLEQCRAVEAARTRLAILKLADGDIDKLVHYISVADDDYREVIMAAEYPECLSYTVSGRPKNRTEQEVWIADWEQYVDWLNR